MALNLHAEKPGMESAASSLEKEVQNFRDATRQARAAADNMKGMWEGDQQVAFMEQQEAADTYYEQLSKLVDDTISTIRKAVKVYSDTDSECAKLLRSV